MTCFILDVPCHVQSWFGWLLIPTWWHVIAGLVLGSILGARFGWLAPISLGLSVLVPVLLGRRKEPVVTDPDFAPPLGRAKPYRKGETAADRWKVD